jgi:hypothetical protein
MILIEKYRDIMPVIDWKIFETKFEGEKTSAFEKLAYILFCSEYDIKHGIFAYYNQTGIETEPIRYNNEVIGFQSKYYTTKVSDNKQDMIDSIDKAKRENEKLTKILFYIREEL